MNELPVLRCDASGGAALKDALKGAARSLGFELVGVAPPGAWPTSEALDGWIDAGFAGDMTYMTREPAIRKDPRSRYPWVRSVLVVGLSYRTRDPAPAAERRPFSRYAWGDDYHDLMAERLRALKEETLALGSAHERSGAALARYTVDTGPLLERAAAAGAGLGWIAKNTMLTSERAGSFFFLGALFLSFPLEPDPAAPGRCGSCARCLDACPTGAFVAPYLLDARRCISYLTIELRGPIPRELRPLMGELVFGCDICQDVCPWNERAERREPPSEVAAFRPRPGLGGRADVPLCDLLDLLALDEGGFRARFRGSAVRRAKRGGLVRNACVALGNRGDPEALGALEERLLRDTDPLVRGHAAWALGAIASRRPETRGRVRAVLERAATDPDAFVREEAAAARGLR